MSRFRLDLDESALTLYDGTQTLFRYVYLPDSEALECRRPCFHPLNTLQGHTLTDFRPADHRWHHGLSFTCASLSGANFWGGPTYIPDRGYVQLANVGSIEHRAWLEMHTDADRMTAAEDLQWRSAGGQPWIEETRRIAARFCETPGHASFWRLEFATALRNVLDTPLEFGSPTTQGRPAAGYGGLFWRGAPAMRNGVLHAPAPDGPPQIVAEAAIMGQRARYLAYSGAVGTLVAIDTPANLRFPTPWFARTSQYPGLSASFMFDTPYALPPGETLRLRYALLIADGPFDAERFRDELPA